MCQECGCGSSETIPLNVSVHQVNDTLAHSIQHKLTHQQVLCINVQGAPGCGKTSFIEGLAPLLGDVVTIQGDLESDVDKVRLEKQHIPTFQINTHSGCHLNAQMIHDSLLNFPLANKKYLFVENVGNLVCPAGVKLGQHINITLSAVTEGSDKPKKYPIIFLDSELIVITKKNLIPHVDFDKEQYLSDLQKINPKAKIVFLGKDDVVGLQVIADFLSHKRQHVIGTHHEHHSHSLNEPHSHSHDYAVNFVPPKNHDHKH